MAFNINKVATPAEKLQKLNYIQELIDGMKNLPTNVKESKKSWEL